MHKKMLVTAAGAQRYSTRMLKAGTVVPMSGPQARLWGKMGWAEPVAKPEKAVAAEPVDDMAALRAEYAEKLGKRAYNGWDAATLRAKIADA